MKTIIILSGIFFGLNCFGFTIVKANLPVNCEQITCLKDRGVSVETQENSNLFVPTSNEHLSDEQWNIYKHLNACFFENEGVDIFSRNYLNVNTAKYNVYRNSLDVATTRGNVPVRMRRITFVLHNNTINFSEENKKEENCEPAIIISENSICSDLEQQIQQNILRYSSANSVIKSEIRRANVAISHQQKLNSCQSPSDPDSRLQQGRAIL